MRSNLTAVWWMGLAFGAAAALAAIVLAAFGADEHGTDVALFVTARLSFLLFWLAYTGSGLVALFGPRFQVLKRHGQDFGLAFASAHLIHVALVAWLCWIGAAPATGVFVFFGIALMWIYLLALFSIGRLQRTLGRTGWWLLRTVGLNYIAYAFASDFVKYPFGGGIKHWIEYMPFVILSIVGPFLYFSSVTLSIGRLWKAPSRETQR